MLNFKDWKSQESNTIDWRGFIGKPFWELSVNDMNEGVIDTETKTVMDRIQIPFKSHISGPGVSEVVFTVRDSKTSREFIGDAVLRVSGIIEIYIKRPYNTNDELIKFKTELNAVLHHELTHWFQQQKYKLGAMKNTLDMYGYISLDREIMAYANQAAKTFTQPQLQEIINVCEFNPNITTDEIISKYGSDPLFSNGNGVIWLYFIWFKKGSPVRKRFMKYYSEYLKLQHS